MLECLFTIDYEIYGNGTGSLRELVHDPTQKLLRIFREAGERFVVFVEAAELERIEAKRTDAAIATVREQLGHLRSEGFEIGLHLHPQWYNARPQNGAWVLEDSEYNLCTLKRERIEWMIRRGIGYLRRVLDEPGFTPLSFRAGNWLLQPSHTVAAVLAEQGIRVDSSVFKGGLQRGRGLDYRPALNNGYYWRFQHDVNVEEPQGRLLEMPIHTRLVPFWRMLTCKRLALQQKGNDAVHTAIPRRLRRRTNRFCDLLRFWYPLKFDFCRMTLDELRRCTDEMIREDEKSPTLLKPLVAIGHTKDLEDLETITGFLSYLKKERIKVSTLEGVYERCQGVAVQRGIQAPKENASEC
jgi:hypothetical protein